MVKQYLFLMLCLVLCLPMKVGAQEMAIKTNGLYWLATTPNLGAEVALSNKFTLELSGAYNRKRIRDAALSTFIHHYTFAAKSKSIKYDSRRTI